MNQALSCLVLKGDVCVEQLVNVKFNKMINIKKATLFIFPHMDRKKLNEIQLDEMLF